MPSIPRLPVPRTTALTAALTLAALGVIHLANPAPAEACGGFFCSNVPMEQAGERIVFGVHEGRVTAHIQINYQGEAPDFGWVVPLSAVPDFSVGPLRLFEELDWRTRPQWNVDWNYDEVGDCAFMNMPMSASAGGAAEAEEDGGGVEILFEEEVGPYDIKVLSAKDASALLDWLEEHDFDQAPGSLPLIDHYLQLDMVFAAVKLSRDAEVGEIQPLVLEMDSAEACVPLVLTRIAALPDMPIQIWMLGDHRAVPTNWFDVEVNHAKIDWFDNGSNYVEVATQAVNEAAGHGFITEFAGTIDMDNSLIWEDQYNTAALSDIGDPSQFLDAMLNQSFPRDAQTQGLIRKHIPMPDPQDLPEDCDEESEYYNWNKETCISQYAPEGWVFDSAAFAADLQERIVDPLEAAQELLDRHPYKTRLFTTVSEHEMTRDPRFDYNSDLPDVDAYHTAQGTGECGEDGQLHNVTLTFEDGRTAFYEGPIELGFGGGVPVAPGSGGSSEPEDTTEPELVDLAVGEPWAATIHLYSTEGPGTEIPHANVTAEDEIIAAADFTHVPIAEEEGITTPAPQPIPDEVKSSGGGSGGCHGAVSTDSDGALPVALGLLILAGLVWASRRRRSEEPRTR